MSSTHTVPHPYGNQGINRVTHERRASLLSTSACALGIRAPRRTAAHKMGKTTYVGGADADSLGQARASNGPRTSLRVATEVNHERRHTPDPFHEHLPTNARNAVNSVRNSAMGNIIFDTSSYA